MFGDVFLKHKRDSLGVELIPFPQEKLQILVRSDSWTNRSLSWIGQAGSQNLNEPDFSLIATTPVTEPKNQFKINEFGRVKVSDSVISEKKSDEAVQLFSDDYRVYCD